MRRRWMGTLALALGVLVPGARAEDAWQAAPGTGGVQLGLPVAASARGAAPMADPSVRPVSFGAMGSGATVIRASGSDLGPAPSGFATSSVNTQFQWRPAPVDQTPTGVTPVSTGGPAPMPQPTTPQAAQTAPMGSSDPVLSMPTPVGSASMGGPVLGSASLGSPVIGSAHPITSIPGSDCGGVDGGICGCSSNLCGDPCCTDGCCYGTGNRWYGSVESLIWFIRGQPLPPLVTTSSTPFAANSGALGAPGTSVLYGGSPVDNGAYFGGRFTAGWWCDPDHSLAFEVSGFFLGSRTASFQDGSNAQSFIARPFFNVDTGMNDKEVTSAPGVIAGRVVVDSRSSLWGAEVNARTNWLCCPNGFVDLIAGFRTVGLNESTTINENVNVLAGPLSGVGFNLYDSFQTNNNFYGGQIGAISEYRLGRWVFDVTTKIALGDTQQVANIYGASGINNNGTVTTYPGNGILAQPSNSGHFSRDRFTVVPELGLSAGYQITDHIRMSAGYNFLYWSSVLRPGNQIDTGLNANQFAPPAAGGAARPAFSYNGSDFWAQGITVSLEFKY